MQIIISWGPGWQNFFPWLSWGNSYESPELISSCWIAFTSDWWLLCSNLISSALVCIIMCCAPHQGLSFSGLATWARLCALRTQDVHGDLHCSSRCFFTSHALTSAGDEECCGSLRALWASFPSRAEQRHDEANVKVWSYRSYRKTVFKKRKLYLCFEWTNIDSQAFLSTAAWNSK